MGQIINRFHHKVLERFKYSSFFGSYNQIMFLLLIICGFLCAIATFLNIGAMSSAIFAGSFVLVGIWLALRIIDLFSNFKKDQDFSQLVVISFILFAAIVGFINILIHTPISYISFNYFKKYIMTLVIIMYCYLLCTFNSSFNYGLIVRYIFLILSFLSAFLFFSGIKANYMYPSTKQFLKFSFENANTAGLIFGLLICMGFYSILNAKKIIRLILIACTLMLFYFLILTKCRSAIYGLVGCGLLFILFTFIIRKTNANTFFSIINILIILMPIIFSSVYLILGLKTNFLSTFLNQGGKSSESRMEVYLRSYQTIFNHPITGYYFNSSRANGAFGEQNFGLELLIEQGIVPTIIYLSIYFLIIYKVNAKTNPFSNNYKVYIGCISCVWFSFLTGVFESSFFIGMSGWYIFAFIFIGLVPRQTVYICNEYVEVNI